MRSGHRRFIVLCCLISLSLGGCGFGSPQENHASGTGEESPAPPTLDPVPLCTEIDLGPVFDAFGGSDPDAPPAARSIGSSAGCQWRPVADDVQINAQIVVGDHPDLSADAIRAYAEAEWAEVSGGEPFPDTAYVPGENGWSYSMTSTVPLIAVLESHWLTYVASDGALRCHFWGFDDISVAWAACDQILAAVSS